VTHVDGTARIQTVTREQNPRYYDLIAAFGRRTGVPILLNTSFNNHAEPIVDSLADAIACFLTTDLHHLVVGDWLVSKRPLDAPVVRGLTIGTAPGLILRAARQPDGSCTHEATHEYHHSRVVRISPRMFEVLRGADGVRSLDDLDRDGDEVLAAELLELWTHRIVSLRPGVEVDTGAVAVAVVSQGLDARASKSVRDETEPDYGASFRQ
jgi:carbamoyltransferase